MLAWNIGFKNHCNIDIQTIIRRKIARKMNQEIDALRAYADSINPSIGGEAIAFRIVPLLIEHGLLGYGRPFENPCARS